MKFYNGSAWQTVGTGTGSGDFMKDGSVTMTGNLKLGANYISNDGGASEGLAFDASGNANFTGNVGIGTSSPAVKLGVVSGSDSSGIQIRRNSASTSSIAVIGLRNATSDSTTNSSQIASIRTNSPSSSDAAMAFSVTTGTALTEVMRLDSTGYVGIGTTSPVNNLEVRGSGTGTATIALYGADSSQKGINIGTDINNRWAIGQNTDAAGRSLYIYRDHTGQGGQVGSVMAILDSGDVGIGLSTPTTKLDVNGTINATAMTINGVPVSAGTGDNLGNHTATQNLNLASYQLVGNGGSSGLAISSDGRVEAKGGILFNQGAGATDNLMYLKSTSSGAVDASMGFFAAGVGSGSASQGPYFLARGNTFSAISNQRGNVMFFAGNPTSPSSGEGGISFWTGAEINRMNITKDGMIQMGNLAQTPGSHPFEVGLGTDFAFLANSNSGLSNLMYLNNSAASAVGNGSTLTFSASSTGSTSVPMAMVSGITTDNGASTFKGDLLLSTANNNTMSEKMRVTSSGNVGIGTTTPARLLHVNGAMRMTPIATAPSTPAAGDMFFDSTASNALKFYNGSAWQTVGTSSGSGDFMKDGSVAMTGNLKLGANYISNDGGASEGLAFDTSGNASFTGKVGIGTGTPTLNLGLSGQAAQTVGMERHATADGLNLTIRAGGAKAGSTNKNGGDLILSSGTFHWKRRIRHSISNCRTRLAIIGHRRFHAGDRDVDRFHR